MSAHEDRLVQEIADILTECLDNIDQGLHPDTVAWLAQSVYDELEDELWPAE